MEGKMIDPHGRVLPRQMWRTVRRGFDSPHRIGSPMNRDAEQTFLSLIGWPMLFHGLLHTFTRDLFQDGDVSLPGHGMHLPPPTSKSTRRAQPWAVPIEYDSIHAIVTAIQQVLITFAERIGSDHEPLLKREQKPVRDLGKQRPLPEGKTTAPGQSPSRGPDAPLVHRRPGYPLPGCVPAEPDSVSPGPLIIPPSRGGFQAPLDTARHASKNPTFAERNRSGTAVSRSEDRATG